MYQEKKTLRETVPAAEEYLGKEIKCLNHGFVRLVDYMGGDAAIVQAARVSYGNGTKKVSEDRGLIRYLMRHRHTTPLEMVEFKFHAKMPIFVARQWIRHRTANVNEVSGRYSIMKDEFYVPEPELVSEQAKSNKQGRKNQMADPELVQQFLEYTLLSQKETYDQYDEFVQEKNLAKELSRINLPLSLYTEWYWKIDLHNLFHFLGLRMDSHAQAEIRPYANAMADITKAVVPIAYEAFEDFRLNSMNLHTPDQAVLNAVITKGTTLEEALELIPAKRERLECKEKIEKMLGVSSAK